MAPLLKCVAAFSLLSAVSSQLYCPDIPLNPPGFTIDPTKVAGIWYEYTYRNGPVGNDPPATNVFMNVTILGPRPNTPTGTSYYITWIYNFFAHVPTQSDPLQCIVFPQQGNLSSDGTRQVVVQIGGPTAPLATFKYTTLYTDYTLVQLWYFCASPNADGQRCDQPFLFTYTRIKPPMLTADQKTYIENLANTYFAKICRGFKDMSMTTWDLTTTFPTCNTGASNTPPLSAAFLASFPPGVKPAR
ncbi:uncharacterized protein LOC129583370 [Paramacrobiotus metropolitanus]|uniref:uncharacterized protein LOC129583370 n=1 Tax=Paramacrobiotus metropolitanus TaxID=2943436 RepID=UPI002445794C|nr:uncharacterized protein LOC129583370 [Paramacrobiotus metropolitanus]